MGWQRERLPLPARRSRSRVAVLDARAADRRGRGRVLRDSRGERVTARVLFVGALAGFGLALGWSLFVFWRAGVFA